MQTRPLKDPEDDQEAQVVAVDDVPDEATPIIIAQSDVEEDVDTIAVQEAKWKQIFE